MYKHKRKVTETNKTVETYERFYRVKFVNPKQGDPGVVFSVETISSEGEGGEAQQKAFPLNPTDIFDVLDNNGEVIDQMQIRELWRGIKSLYYYLDPDTE